MSHPTTSKARGKGFLFSQSVALLRLETISGMIILCFQIADCYRYSFGILEMKLILETIYFTPCSFTDEENVNLKRSTFLR